MFNRRRLTRLGTFWLEMLHVAAFCFVIAAALAAYGSFAPYFDGRRGATLFGAFEQAANALGGLFAAWANVSIVLGVLIWTQTSRMSKAEDEAWDAIDAERKGKPK